MKSVLHKYCNPDTRCHFPCCKKENDKWILVDYCWSFANYMDGTETYEKIEEICKNGPCEYWNE